MDGLLIMQESELLIPMKKDVAKEVYQSAQEFLGDADESLKKLRERNE